MTQTLQKVGLPPQMAAGARLARRMRDLLAQRDAAMARIEADFRARMKALLEEDEADDAKAEAPEATPAPEPALA
jgi:hypothetical protein